MLKWKRTRENPLVSQISETSLSEREVAVTQPPAKVFPTSNQKKCCRKWFPWEVLVVIIILFLGTRAVILLMKGEILKSSFECPKAVALSSELMTQVENESLTFDAFVEKHALNDTDYRGPDIKSFREDFWRDGSSEINDKSQSCCLPGGCLCPNNRAKCRQCGLGGSCKAGWQENCNMTVVYDDIKHQSKLDWAFIPSPWIFPEKHCWYRFTSSSPKVLEIVLYQLNVVPLGIDPETESGDVDVGVKSEIQDLIEFREENYPWVSTGKRQLSSPIKWLNLDQFGTISPPPERLISRTGNATLFIRPFTEVIKFIAVANFIEPRKIKTNGQIGGELQPHSLCDYTYDNCYDRDRCRLSTPYFFKLSPPQFVCRFVIKTDDVADTVRIDFSYFNLQTSPNCTKEHLVFSTVEGSINDGSCTKVRKMVPIPPLCGYRMLTEKHEATGTYPLTIELKGGDVVATYVSQSQKYGVMNDYGFHAVITVVKAQNHSTYPTFSKRTREGILRRAVSSSTTNSSSTSSSSKLGRSMTTKGFIPRSSILITPSSQVTSSTTRETPVVKEFIDYPTVCCGHEFKSHVSLGHKFRLLMPTRRNYSYPLSRNKTEESSKDPAKPWKKFFLCTLTFTGSKDSNIVRVVLFNYHFRGDQCSTFVRFIEFYRSTDKNTDNTDLDVTRKETDSGNSCNWLEKKPKLYTSHSNQLFVDVLIPEPTQKNSRSSTQPEFLDGVFHFLDHHEGIVKSGTTCDLIYNSKMDLGSTGYITSSAFSPVFLPSFYPVECKSYFITDGPKERISLTILSMSHTSVQDRDGCKTICNNFGCTCQLEEDSIASSMKDVNHLLVTNGNTTLACLCGLIWKYTPITIESNFPLTLVQHQVSDNRQMNFAGKFSFDKSKSQCKVLVIRPPSGFANSSELLYGKDHEKSIKTGKNHYKIYQCPTWRFKNPKSHNLVLEIGLGGADFCRQWDLKVFGTLKMFDGNINGTDRKIRIFSLCPIYSFVRNTTLRIPINEGVPFGFIQFKMFQTTIIDPEFSLRWTYRQKPGYAGNGNVLQPHKIIYILLAILHHLIKF